MNNVLNIKNMLLNKETDHSRIYVTPRIKEEGSDNAPHSYSEERALAKGRMIVCRLVVRRRPQKRFDYLLHTCDLVVATVEAMQERTVRTIRHFSKGYGLNLRIDEFILCVSFVCDEA